jgi:hypothetical protein
MHSIEAFGFGDPQDGEESAICRETVLRNHSGCSILNTSGKEGSYYRFHYDYESLQLAVLFE